MNHIITYRICEDVDNNPFDNIHQSLLESFEEMETTIRFLQEKYGSKLRILIAAELKCMYKIDVETKITFNRNDC